jgi:hypothetical protein
LAIASEASYLNGVAGLLIIIELFRRAIAVKLVDNDVRNALCNGLGDVDGLA